MLPNIRTSENIFQIPCLEIKADDVQEFLPDLQGFHEEFKDCFSRSESRQNFYKYMVGQFSKLERKSIEPIALAVKKGKVRAMQNFVSDAYWDETRIKNNFRSMVQEDLGEEDGVLIFDESSFIKKGKDSAGVAKQYCGSIGKVENCQVGVFAGYASSMGYSLIDHRLFVPEKWFSEDFATRRIKCKFPKELNFKTKPQLAIEMFLELKNENKLTFKYIVADSIYGSSPEFIQGIEKHPELTYFVSVPSDTLCWIKKPEMEIKKIQYAGKIKTMRVVANKVNNAPKSFKDIGNTLNDFFWYRRKVSEGTKGPIEYEFYKKRVVLAKKGVPDKEVWLIIRRSLEDNPEYSYFISNARLSTRLKTFVWLSGMRWAIEQCFEETKTELGMDHYEVRKFPGWVHHMLTCILAHFFLWHIKIKLEKKSSGHYFVTD